MIKIVMDSDSRSCYFQLYPKKVAEDLNCGAQLQAELCPNVPPDPPDVIYTVLMSFGQRLDVL